jgi:hypothetical protein
VAAFQIGTPLTEAPRATAKPTARHASSHRDRQDVPPRNVEGHPATHTKRLSTNSVDRQVIGAGPGPARGSRTRVWGLVRPSRG